MDSFQAQLTVGGDPTPIETTVILDGANLEIASFGESLGRWPIADLGLERVLGGYKMRVEGETATLKFPEPEKFAHALDGPSTVERKTVAKPKKPKEQKREREAKTRGRHAPAVVSDAAPAVSDAAPAVATPASAKPAKTKSSVGWLDQTLEGAQRRFGKRLPDWVFSRGGLVVALGVLALVIAKPGWFSALFLIGAAIGLITSAIALLDQVVAVRIFRGGFTPIQGLIISLVVGLVGILLGAI